MADHLDVSPTVTPLVWNIAFCSSSVSSWWDVLSPAWCRHVLAFGFSPGTQTWTVVECGDDRLMVLSIPDGPVFDEWLARLMRAKAVILRHTAKDAPSHRHRIGVWCSSMVGRLTGVPGGAWRPMVLYRSLVADGAQPAFGTPPYVLQGKGPERRSCDTAGARSRAGAR